MLSSVQPSASSGRIKGLAFREFLRWHTELYGQAPVVKAVMRLPASQRELFNLAHDAYGILPSSWYPAEVVHRILDRISEGRSESELEALARAAAVPIMQRMIHGVYEFAFSRLASPARWVALRQHIWDLYYDTGTIEAELVGDDAVRNVIVGWRGHHPLACKLTRAANLAIYPAMGLSQVNVELTGCTSFGDPRCEVWIRWSTGR